MCDFSCIFRGASLKFSANLLFLDANLPYEGDFVILYVPFVEEERLIGLVLLCVVFCSVISSLRTTLRFCDILKQTEAGEVS